MAALNIWHLYRTPNEVSMEWVCQISAFPLFGVGRTMTIDHLHASEIRWTGPCWRKQRLAWPSNLGQAILMKSSAQKLHSTTRWGMHSFTWEALLASVGMLKALPCPSQIRKSPQCCLSPFRTRSPEKQHKHSGRSQVAPTQSCLLSQDTSATCPFLTTPMWFLRLSTNISPTDQRTHCSARNSRRRLFSKRWSLSSKFKTWWFRWIF